MKSRLDIFNVILGVAMMFTLAGCGNSLSSSALDASSTRNALSSIRTLKNYRCPSRGKPITVAFFDADSTLRVSKSGAPTANTADDVNLLPLVSDEIVKLNRKGHLTAIVSNQGGVAAGYVTADQAAGGLLKVAEMIAVSGGRFNFIDMAEGNDEFRKPNPGMANRLNAALEAKCGRGFSKTTSYMVGDAGYKKGVDGPDPVFHRPADDFSNSDRLFAENVGIAFSEPALFFGWHAYDVYNILSETELKDFLVLIEERAAALLASDVEESRRLATEVKRIRVVNGF